MAGLSFQVKRIHQNGARKTIIMDSTAFIKRNN